LRVVDYRRCLVPFYFYCRESHHCRLPRDRKPIGWRGGPCGSPRRHSLLVASPAPRFFVCTVLAGLSRASAPACYV